MTSFARQHEYRLGRALLVATLMVVLGSWLFPVEWLRFFGRPVGDGQVAEAVGEPWIRLIPAESLERREFLVPVQTVFEPVASPSPDQSAPVQRREWSFDPTTAWRPLTGAEEPLGPALRDSILRRAELLDSMRLANWGAVFAMLDTTQAGRAREQLAETDEWVNRRWGPMWAAQGFAKRQANLWYRVVTEVEAEGSH